MEELKNYVIKLKSGKIKGGRFTHHEKVGVFINFYKRSERILSIPDKDIKKGGIKC